MKYKPSIYNNFFEFDSKQYLYNAHSGFFCELDEETLNYINCIDKNVNAEDCENFSVLLKKGVIIPNEIDEFNLIKMRSLSEQYSYDSSILSFVVATTRNCNYKCVYCFEGNLHDNLNMSEETQNAVIDFVIHSLKNYSKCRKLHITWFGGEPLLNIPCIENISQKLIYYCDTQNINYNADIITNGLLLTPETMNKLIKLRVDGVQISIDGYEKEYCTYKGATKKQFEMTINNICSIPSNIRLSIRCNTDLKNYDSIKRVTKLIIDRLQDVTKRNIIFYLAPIEHKKKMSLSEKEFNDITKDYLQFLSCEKMFNSIKGNMPQPRYVSCGALKKGNYCIDSDGGLVKCEHYIGNDLKKCGDVFNGPNYKSTEVDLCCLPIEDKCRTCSIYPICRGGCAQRRLDKKIDVDCGAFKERVETYLYFLSKGLS